jgi:hypothetical protein
MTSFQDFEYHPLLSKDEKAAYHEILRERLPLLYGQEKAP